ncbi:Galactomannan galactosyltransferase 1 [Heracleum sosnowskyi]|uniref:Galactomannan galactosyltransferase 1 n=1 Tax=Heracleum sosnowskyi TaxID=360622 RepID=A0AAD8IEU7_9APIA|nr:Galactomannan galactosyltransferase 1 [Heracleum sosnowskyi]
MKKQKVAWSYDNNNKKLKRWLSFVLAMTGVILAAWGFSSFFEYSTSTSPVKNQQTTKASGYTFYDDPNLSYLIGDSFENWDEKRAEWLKHHPGYINGAENRVLLVTGSQSSSCESPVGDYFLLRLFKNKVDYCRIHGYDIFYNTALLHPKMDKLWAKVAAIRAAMLAHPEMEWIWWVDADAVVTNMEFKLPLEKYKNHNIVVDGRPDQIFEKRSWIGLNAGVVLFRNCQWTMEFLNTWASMGPMNPGFKMWGKIFKSTFTDVPDSKSNDQSAMAYMVLKQFNKWGSKFYMENEFCFQCYWAMAVDWFKNATNAYMEMELSVSELSRRHAELATESYGELREKYLEQGGYGKKTGRRPFITHFTGCSPCNGKHDPIYDGDSCRQGMEKALNFADNQVLRNFGFVRRDLSNASSPVFPFDVPASD